MILGTYKTLLVGFVGIYASSNIAGNYDPP